jgi:hypothetical protein
VDILAKLKDASTSIENLEEFIENNIRELYDLMLYSRYDELNKIREDIDEYILTHLKIIKELDFNNSDNQTFINILIEVAERFSFGLSFSRLFGILTKSGITVSSRINATSLYNLNIREFKDFENIFDKLFETLLLSVGEDDDYDKIFAVAINFYAKVVHNFSEFNNEAVIIIRDRISKLIKTADYSFLDNDLINSILELDVKDNELAYSEIQVLLDGYLNRTKFLPDVSLTEYLLEIDTEYAELLKSVVLKFEHIRQISVKSFNLIEDGTSKVFKSLGRGVAILGEESQLFAYMNSYSNMHYHKLKVAYGHLSSEFYKHDIEIYDWGCGQGIATLSYLDFLLNDKEINQKVSKVNLIEPSKVAIKRAALHVRKYNSEVPIYTLNKDFDSLSPANLIDTSLVKLHLFSNVLDMEQFSLSSLIGLIGDNLSGLNYFVCVSPFVNTLKTNRVNIFMKSFSKFSNYEELLVLDKRNGEWINNWTKVVRVFKCEI